MRTSPLSFKQRYPRVFVRLQQIAVEGHGELGTFARFFGELVSSVGHGPGNSSPRSLIPRGLCKFFRGGQAGLHAALAAMEKEEARWEGRLRNY